VFSFDFKARIYLSLPEKVISSTKLVFLNFDLDNRYRLELYLVNHIDVDFGRHMTVTCCEIAHWPYGDNLNVILTFDLVHIGAMFDRLRLR